MRSRLSSSWMSCGLALALLLAAGPAAAVDLAFRYDGGGSDPNPKDPLHAMAVDAAGNVWVTGARGNNSGAEVSNSYFIARYDAQANLLWTREYRSGQGSYIGMADTMVVDAAGNAYLALAEWYVFGAIIKYGPDGTQTVLAPGEGLPYNWDSRVQLHLGPDGSLFLLAGNTVKKYSAAGTQVWSKLLVDGGWFHGTRGIATDALGNAYVVSVSNGDVTLVKFDAQGSRVWVRTYDSGGYDVPAGVALDSQGRVVVVTSGKVGARNAGIVLLEYDSAGALLFTRGYEYGGDTRPVAFALEASGNVVVTASLALSDPTRPYNTYDWVTVKYDSAGYPLWMQRFDGGWDDVPNAVAVDGAGNVFVTGSRAAYSHWSSTYFHTVGYDAQGGRRWQLAGPNGVATRLHVSATGEVYTGGSTYYPDDALVVRSQPPITACP